MKILIKNGEFYDVKKALFVEADILIEDKKIRKIEKDLDVRESLKIIEAEGQKIFPGFIDAHSHIGMWTDTPNGNDASSASPRRRGESPRTSMPRSTGIRARSASSCERTPFSSGKESSRSSRAGPVPPWALVSEGGSTMIMTNTLAGTVTSHDHTSVLAFPPHAA